MAKTAAQRKQTERERKAQHLINVGAKNYTMKLYRATQEELEFLKQAGDFGQSEEVIALLIKNAAEIIKRDMSQTGALLRVPSHKVDVKDNSPYKANDTSSCTKCDGSGESYCHCCGNLTDCDICD
jgi:hypothetical protein